ncbi:hypothetical protein DL764_008394 [Monosporascus ibericus]|uniref:Transcription factor TFIIIC triple barrel domain-containing protein n=1 Tax=Monosporascus ibericus TaxID=155417 RepID=A0A4Q4T0E8_9PEZI|nr:hypothetical protein DL764_008394 [Monosporascus ibericus]
MTSTQIDQGAPEDESEWEYEYSTTETETFYVTLDLSTADFTAPHKNIISNVRTDYHGNRLTEAERIRRRNAVLSPFDSEGEDEDGQGGAQHQHQQRRLDESQEAAAAAAEEEEAAGGNRGEEHEEPDAAASEEFSAEKVQIMELHSPNPVISYKGRVYEGQWSRHVGTELLLTTRDRDGEGEDSSGSGSSNPNPYPNTLPALRHLDNGVDLLAASCARITVTQREPERREDTEEGRRRRARLALSEEREVMATRIPPPETTRPSRARVDQAHFLARLIALKKRKGETDEVAVLVNGYSRDLVKRSRARKGDRGGPGRASGRGGRRRPRGAETGLFDHAAFLQNCQHPAQVGDGELPDSAPTPRQWDDLRDAEPGADEVDAGSGSEDENAVQEDDNTMMVDEDEESASTGDEGSGAEDDEEEESGIETSGPSDDGDSEAEEMDVDERQ